MNLDEPVNNENEGSTDSVAKNASLSSGSKIGLGLGIPLIIILPIIFFFIVWQRRRRNRKPQTQLVGEMQHAELQSQDLHKGGVIKPTELDSVALEKPPTQELSSSRHQVDASQSTELDSGTARRSHIPELSGTAEEGRAELDATMVGAPRHNITKDLSGDSENIITPSKSTPSSHRFELNAQPKTEEGKIVLSPEVTSTLSLLTHSPRVQRKAIIMMRMKKTSQNKNVG